MRAVLLLSTLLGFTLFVPLSSALAGVEDEASRQLELAEQDLAAGLFERAAASAASALRLDPGRHDALVVRGLALMGLGRLEDAAALLRAYRDLRGSLPLDERVEPALAEIDQLLSTDAGSAKTPGNGLGTEEPVSTVIGPVAVVYGPGNDEHAAERAYAAAHPFLAGEPATSILPLASLLPRGEALVVLGAEVVPCAAPAPEVTLAGQLAAAEAAVTELEPGTALEAAAIAEEHLACGQEPIELTALGRLLAVRALARWTAGEPEQASRLWHELFSFQKERMVDSALPPAAQALQLDAKLRAEAEPVEVELAPILPAGWALQIDGRAHARGPVPAGRRVLHLVGPEGQRIGAVLPLEAAAAVHVSTHDGLREAAQAARPDGPVLRWLAVRLTPLLEREARAVLVVNLSAEPPIVRHFDGERFLVLTATSPAGWRADAVLAGGRGVPRGASAALLGGGLAATAVGVIVAALAHRDGVALEEEMQTGIGFSDNHAGFQAAVAQERLGVGLAAGGGVVAGVGAVTFVLPPLRAGRGGGP